MVQLNLHWMGVRSWGAKQSWWEHFPRRRGSVNLQGLLQWKNRKIITGVRDWNLYLPSGHIPWHLLHRAALVSLNWLKNSIWRGRALFDLKFQWLSNKALLWDKLLVLSSEGFGKSIATHCLWWLVTQMFSWLLKICHRSHCCFQQWGSRSEEFRGDLQSQDTKIREIRKEEG